MEEADSGGVMPTRKEKSEVYIVADKDKTDDTFYRENLNDFIWWVDNPDIICEYLFSFDKKEIFNLFTDYPWNLTKEQKEIFDKENPFWADFFHDRE